MPVDESLLLKLERLTRLRLDANERTQLATDLEKMLAMVDRLKEVDTEGVAPLLHLNETDLPPLRPDEPAPPVTAEQALRNAPDREGPYFRVPKVIDLDTD